MSIYRSITFLALAAALLASTGWADRESTELTITKARIDFSRKAGRDALQLSVAFDPDLLSSDVPPNHGSLSVTIGPETVISLPVDADRGRWQVKERKGLYRYRLKQTKKHPDALDLKVNVVKGVLKLTADRLNLSGLHGEGPGDVVFTVTVSGATLTKTVTMGRKDWRWRYRYTTRGKVTPKGVPGGGAGGTDPEPDPDPIPTPNIVWRELDWGYGAQAKPAGQAIARTQAAYETLWKLARGSATPPTVDFGEKMVVAIFLGRRIMAKVEIVSVERDGGDIRVTYRVVADTRRYFAPVPPYPHYIFEMTRTSEPVVFTQVP